jgi:subtilase family protein/peptidase inhibitor I9
VVVLSTRRVVSGVGLLTALIALSQFGGSAVAGAQSQAATQGVIVVLKNQVKNLPPTRALIGQRRAAIAVSQSSLNSQLTNSGARGLHSYAVVNAVSATVSPSEESQLKSNPAVSEVIPDQVLQLGPTQEQGTASPSAATGTSPIPGACAPPGKTLLEPQALQIIHADSQQPNAKTARSLGFTGAGVTVGFIADGLDINNPDFIRPGGQHVFVDYKDFSGDGTDAPTAGGEAFGDASSIAAQGNLTYNVSNYSHLPLNRPCNIKIEGVAPGASLVGLDVFGTNGGFSSSFLQAIDYAVSVDHVNVLNESLGNNFYPDDQASLDLIKQANDEAVAAGTTVTVSSGDAGVTSTVGTPATDPNIISVAASTDYRIDAQIGYGGFRFPGVTGWLNNNISSFSSGGFEQDGQAVDVIGPGEDGWALCSTNNAMYADCTDFAGNPTPVEQFGGTSESAPLTAATAALVIQAYRSTHGGASPSPAVTKQIITSTADDIGAPADQQGTGEIDAYKAVLAAESYRAPASVPTPKGDTILTSSNQLNAIDNPGTPETFTDTVTNNGARNQTITVSTRQIGAYRLVKSGVVTLSDTNSPHITDWQGVQDNYEPFTFNVPQGQNRLNLAAAFQNAGNAATDPSLHARVRITLVDPQGDLAEYSRPQGDGNYGDIQITNPVPGKWIAYVYSRNSSAGGTTGPVVVGASVAKYTSFGHASPGTLNLAPGQSGTVTLRVSTPSTPSDEAGAIVLSSNQGVGFGRVTTIPVTLRSLIPNGNQPFTGTLTGGNGREFFIGQTNYYQLDVSPGRPELNATVTLADNPNNSFDAWLVSPTGEALAFASNALPNSFSQPTEVQNQIGAQVHVLNPAQGAWTLIITFAPQVSGTALSEPFQVTTNESAVPASASGLPNSASTKLAAGTPVTANVQVENTGPAPEAFFVDPRQPTSTTLNLGSFSNPNTTVPLGSGGNIPVYLVPTHTTAFSEQASTTGSQPILFDSGATAGMGDPDLASTAGTSATAALTDNPISQGIWDIAPEEVGPFGTAPAPMEPVTTAMQATANAFDGTVSSPTGDLWETSANPGLLGSFNPVVVQPGQTATIPVTITPTGASGSTDSGTLYLDDANFSLFLFDIEPNGNEVAAIPYSYTVK